MRSDKLELSVKANLKQECETIKLELQSQYDRELADREAALEVEYESRLQQ